MIGRFIPITLRFASAKIKKKAENVKREDVKRAIFIGIPEKFTRFTFHVFTFHFVVPPFTNWAIISS